MKTQRKTVTVLITMICVLAMKGLFAQCDSYNFSSPAGWTSVGSQVTIGTGKVNFAVAADGTIPRFVHTNLTSTLSELAWSCDFEFTANSGSGPFHALVAFTEAGAPILNASGNYSPSPMHYSNTNCIAVFVTGPAGNTSVGSWTVYAAAKKRVLTDAYGYTLLTSPTWSSSASIAVGAAGVTRYMRIQRLDNTRCKLTMFSDAARTLQVGSSCFTIPAGTYNLGNVQVGNCPEGSSIRTFTGTVDNIKVCSLNPQLIGSNAVCSTTPTLFKLQNGNASVTTNCGFPGATSFTWSAPAGSTLGNGIGGECYTSLGIGGNGSRNLITVGSSGIITCTVNYGCASVTYTFSVTVSNPTTAVITTLTNYCFGSPIIVNGTSSANETNYFWSAAPCDELGLLTGPWVDQPIQTGTAGIYDITPLLGLPPLATCSLNYSIKLTTSNPLCGSTISFFPSIIRIYKAPEMAVSMAAFLCEDECANLSVGGPCSYLTTYTWSPASGLDITSGTNVVACPEVSTTYTVIGTNPGCPPGSASIPVTVSTLNVNAGPDHSMCCSETFTMSPTVSGGTAPYIYQWLPTTGLSCTDCLTPIVDICTQQPPLSSVTYTLTVTDDNLCTDSDIITIFLVPCRLAVNENNQSEEAASSEQISVFPNPASQVIQITTGSYTASKIEITDLAGRVVVSTKPQSNKVELNIADLPEGSYLIRVETLSGIETREIIVTH